MAYKKRKTFSKKKKTYRRRRTNMGNKNTPNLVSPGRMITGFPPKMIMKHKYFETFDITNTTGNPAYYSFYCNNLYDPNYSSTGHQPYYYDTCTAIYDHWVVIGAKIRWRFQAASASNTTLNIGMYLNDDATITPTYASLHEVAKGKWTTLPTGYTGSRDLVMGYSARKSFGGSILAQNNLRGDAGTSPTETQFWSVGVFPQNLSSTQTTNCQVEIEYIVVWSELKDITGS